MIGMGAFLATVGAGLAMGISAMGSGIGVGITGAAGAGVVAEKQEFFSKGLIFSALPQTQAIYGFVTAIFILIGTGLLGGGAADIPVSVGLVAVGCGLAVGFAGLSAIGQGIAASSSIGAVAEKPEMFGKGLMFSALPETQAIYGLVVAILLMNFSGILTREYGAFLKNDLTAVGFVAVACGLAIGIAGLSGIGQGIACAGGISATAEKPGMFGKGLMFSALPETQAIYGLVVAILLMQFAGIFAKTFTIDINQGMAVIGAGLAIGIAGLSAIGQGITCSAAIGATTRNPEAVGRGLMFAIMSETFAIFGLVIALLIMFGVELM